MFFHNLVLYMCSFKTKLLIDTLEKTLQNSGDEESALKSPAQNQTSWLMLVVPTLRMLRQENCCELKVMSHSWYIYLKSTHKVKLV